MINLRSVECTLRVPGGNITPLPERPQVRFAANGYDVVGRRLMYDALWFGRNYVFPPSDAELLSVRGAYNKQAVIGLADTGTMPPSAYVSEKDGNSDI